MTAPEPVPVRPERPAAAPPQNSHRTATPRAARLAPTKRPPLRQTCTLTGVTHDSRRLRTCARPIGSPPLRFPARRSSLVLNCGTRERERECPPTSAKPVGVSSKEPSSKGGSRSRRIRPHLPRPHRTTTVTKISYTDKLTSSKQLLRIRAGRRRRQRCEGGCAVSDATEQRPASCTCGVPTGASRRGTNPPEPLQTVRAASRCPAPSP